MKIKWRILLFSLGILIILTSCGVVKKAIIPRYRFEIGKTLYYKLKSNADFSVDAGFVKYNGKIIITADVELTALGTNENGYKIRMDIKNPEIKGANNQISAAFYIGLNAIRNWYAEFYLTDKGRTIVMMQSTPVLALSSYSSLVFPDFTDFDAILKGQTDKTNFYAKLQDQELTVVFDRFCGVNKSDKENLWIDNQIKFTSYAKDEFLKTVEPLPIGYINFNMSDVFNYIRGKLNQKTGNFNVSYNLPIKQGFLTYSINVIGNGDIELKLTDLTN